MIPEGKIPEMVSPTQKDRNQLILEALQATPNISVAGVVINRGGNFLETYHIMVSPTQSILSIKELMDFMENLLPGEERTSINEVNAERKSGSLCFDEVIGTEQVTTITKTSAFNPKVFELAGESIGTRTFTGESKLYNRAWVNVYSDPDSAQKAFKKAQDEANRPKISEGE